MGKLLNEITYTLLQGMNALILILAFCSAGNINAQQHNYWTLERLGGPIAPVEKLIHAAFVALDDDMRLAHEGSILKLRIDPHILEAQIHQTLQETTGGAFRTLHAQLVTTTELDGVLSVGNGRLPKKFDLAAALLGRPDLLVAFGLPQLNTDGSAEDQEAQHAALKAWMIEHPEQHAALMRTILAPAANE
jgi:hypothetical protein